MGLTRGGMKAHLVGFDLPRKAGHPLLDLASCQLLGYSISRLCGLALHPLTHCTQVAGIAHMEAEVWATAACHYACPAG